MEHSALSEVALRHLPVAGAHHLALYTIIIIAWVRRRSLERLFAAYFAVAFATTAYALLLHDGTRAWGAISAVLAAMWLLETVRSKCSYDFASTPRPRLVIMTALAAFAILYPGYSGTLPTFLFSPLGVLLPPTLIAALCLLNAASPESNRRLHWALAAVGLAVAVDGIAAEGWRHAPLTAVSAYAVPLLLGAGRRRETQASGAATSVRDIRDRMYARRTFLPGPGSPRTHRRSGRIRRR